jgi:hypothetical protein
VSYGLRRSSTMRRDANSSATRRQTCRIVGVSAGCGCSPTHGTQLAHNPRMELENWELAAPARLIGQIASRHRLVAGLALLAVVEDPAGRQTLAHIELLPIDCRIEHHPPAADLLYETMQRLPVPDFAGPGTQHSVVTVIVRPGLAEAGPYEAAWTSAWKKSNHLRPAFTGNVLLVTEHGWYDLMSHLGASFPRMQSA